MFLIWWIGFLFTDGLIDPMDKQSIWKWLKRFFVWPVELGKYLHDRLEK